MAILGYRERSVKTKEDVVLIIPCQMYLGASKELSHQPKVISPLYFIITRHYRIVFLKYIIVNNIFEITRD